MSVDTPIRSMPSRKASSLATSPTWIDATSKLPARISRRPSAMLMPMLWNSLRSTLKPLPLTDSIVANSTGYCELAVWDWLNQRTAV